MKYAFLIFATVFLCESMTSLATVPVTDISTIDIYYLHNRLTPGRLTPEDLLEMYSFRLTVRRPSPRQKFSQSLLSSLNSLNLTRPLEYFIDCRWAFNITLNDGRRFLFGFREEGDYVMFNAQVFKANSQTRKWLATYSERIFDTTRVAAHARDKK
jgi:hypothetical protein